MKYIIEKVQLFNKNLKEDHIEEYATQCAYYTILAFIPFLMLIITLIKYIGLEENILFFAISQMVPENFLNATVMDIVKEVYSKSIGTVTISALFTLWSAGRGFTALCKGLSSIYKTKEEKMYILFRIRATILTAIFIVMIILVLLLMVFGNTINTLLIKKFNIYSKIFNFIIRFKTIVTALVLFLVFLPMYRFIPKHIEKKQNFAISALIASVGCIVISYLFSIYVEVFNGFSIMYGSLTTIVLVMMWVYACMYTILLGAEIGKFIK